MDNIKVISNNMTLSLLFLAKDNMSFYCFHNFSSYHYKSSHLNI